MKVVFFKIAPKNYNNTWGTFYNKICYQEVENIAQSGHTG